MPVRANAGTNRPDRTGALRQLAERPCEPAIFQVDDQTVRSAQRKYVVLHRSTQIKNDPGPPILGPDPNIFDGRCSVCKDCWQQQNEGEQKTALEAHPGGKFQRFRIMFDEYTNLAEKANILA